MTNTVRRDLPFGAYAPPAPAAAAAVVDGRYVLERELGRGGMATVYLATELRHDRRVALKLVRADVAASLGTERFLHEIRVISRLVHPHILPLYDSGEHEGRPYFVTPFVEGETLQRRIERGGALPVAEAVRLAAEAADALAYMHAVGVVHRDLKPDNLLLCAGHAVVADFGVCRGGADAALTSPGFAVGTPAYMSPEQASGQRDVDGRSDVYSLACVLYAALTGATPFRGATPRAVAAQHVTAPPPSARLARPEVPAWLDAVLLRAMAKDPDERLGDARAFAGALAAGRCALGGRPAAARGRAGAAAAWAALAGRVAGRVSALGARR